MSAKCPAAVGNQSGHYYSHLAVGFHYHSVRARASYQRSRRECCSCSTRRTKAAAGWEDQVPEGKTIVRGVEGIGFGFVGTGLVVAVAVAAVVSAGTTVAAAADTAAAAGEFAAYTADVAVTGPAAGQLVAASGPGVGVQSVTCCAAATMNCAPAAPFVHGTCSGEVVWVGVAPGQQSHWHWQRSRWGRSHYCGL